MLSILKKYNNENGEIKFDCQLFFDEWSDGLLISDMATKHFIAGNKAICKMLGYTKEDIRTLEIKDIHPPADLPNVLNQFEYLLTGKITVAINLPVQKKDGSVFYVDITVAPVTISGKNYIMGNFRDVTERLNMAANFKALFDSSQDAVMTIEPPAWQFTSANLATIKLFGVKDEAEFISTSPWNLSPEYQPDGQLSKVKAKEMIEKSMSEGKNLFEWTHKKKNGEEFIATILLSRVVIGSKTFIQATVRDVTEQNKEKEMLKNINELLSLYIENSPIYTYIKSVTPTESRVILASKNFNKMIGGPVRSINGKTMSELFPAEFAKKITADDWSVISSGGAVRVEENLGGKNYITVKFPIMQKDKKLLAGYTIDITEQQNKTIELERTNKLMIGRELKMAELKQEIEQLKKQLKLK